MAKYGMVGQDEVQRL